MVLKAFKDRLVAVSGRAPSIFFLPSSKRHELQEAWSKHVARTIHNAEEQLASDSDDDGSVDTDSVLLRQGTGLSDTEVNAALSLLHVGEHLVPGSLAIGLFPHTIFDQPRELASRVSYAASGVNHYGGYLGTIPVCEPSSSSFSQACNDAPAGGAVSYPLPITRSENGTHAHVSGGLINSQAGDLSSTRKRGSSAASKAVSKKLKPPDQDLEFPDLFYAHNPTRYQVFKCSCSRGQRVYDFLKNSIAKHKAAGHFAREFGSEEAGQEAYDRVKSAKAARGGPTSLYKAKRQALWGTDTNVPIAQCPDHGEHELWELKKIIRYAKSSDSHVSDAASVITDDVGVLSNNDIQAGSSFGHSASEQIQGTASSNHGDIHDDQSISAERLLSPQMARGQDLQGTSTDLTKTDKIRELEARIEEMSNRIHSLERERLQQQPKHSQQATHESVGNDIDNGAAFDQDINYQMPIFDFTFPSHEEVPETSYDQLRHVTDQNYQDGSSLSTSLLENREEEEHVWSL